MLGNLFLCDKVMLRSARKSGIATTDIVASGFNPMNVK
jgi:hypothetical protein